ncbi:hypothetical protein KY290_014892 [Solanum tuberosum]|uniref:Uncharacterized protein n=1 Tax=Solanum tuberosum TaxID=4113 RepID=A0ABQ7VS72_SOLTU|nr:hypothetical protein KY285_014335 [Solanum tuberosum]KAH0770911.1 hypothetical protein KY290_014892 [Solanum tuberosum]
MASPAGSSNSASIRKMTAQVNNNNNTSIDTSSPNLMVENDVAPPPPPSARPLVTEIEMNTNPFYNYGEQVVLQRGWGLPPYVCKEVIKTPTGLRAIAVRRRRNEPNEGSCITSVGGPTSSTESVSNKKNQP